MTFPAVPELNRKQARRKTQTQAIAALIGFPELAKRLPPQRRCRIPEVYRMSIFDAVAFAITFFCFRAGRTTLVNAHDAYIATLRRTRAWG